MLGVLAGVVDFPLSELDDPPSELPELPLSDDDATFSLLGEGVVEVVLPRLSFL